MKIYACDFNVKKYPCKLYACLRFMMRLCRWAGLFPVQGLDQLSADGINFRVKCFYIVYNIATIIGQLSMACFTFMGFCDDISLISLSKAVFFGSALVSALLIIRLAKHWQVLMKKAKEIEGRLIKLNLDNCVIRKSSLVAGVIMMLALVEYLFSLYFSLKRIMDYLHRTEINGNIIEIYVIHKLPSMFHYITYSHFCAFLSELLSLQATFIWNFNDVLIICFSIYISSYFQSLNKAIRAKRNNSATSWGEVRENYSLLTMLVKEINGQLSPFILLASFLNLFYICLQLFHSLRTKSSPYYTYCFIFVVLRALALCIFAADVHVNAQKPIIYVIDVPSSDYDKENYLRSSTWSTLREDYTRATRLIRMFDDVLSSLVLISFSTNLFFICLQLFNVLENGVHSRYVTAAKCANFGSGPFYGYEYTVYLMYSLTFLFTRFLTVSLVAASVNVASEVPAFALYRVPSCCYSEEVERFLEQVHDDVVAFSGLGFFYITREIVLSVVGTITTYELVLLQFNTDELNNS